MRRGIIIGFAVLGLTACGQRQQGSTEGQQSQPAAPSAQQAAPSGQPAAPSAAATEAAKPDVGAGANQDATSCLDLVASANYSEAVPVCTRALSLDSTNDKVKTALETANAKLAESAAGAAAGATGAAQGAADEATKQIPKSY